MRYAEMKTSGVEWIGDIPVHWKVIRLKRLARRKTKLTSSLDGYIGLENVQSWTGELLQSSADKPEPEAQALSISAGDVIFGKLRPYLAKCHLVQRDGCCSSEFLVLDSGDLVAAFLKYLFFSPSFINEVNMATYGTKMPRANWEIVGWMPMPTPPLAEQSAIAAYLDEKCGAIDKIIEEAKTTIEEYKAWKSSVIFEAVTKGLDPNAEMKDSGVEWMGEIPKHWSCIPMKFMLNERNQKNDPVVTSERLSLSIDIGVTLYAEKTTNLDRFKEDVSQYKVAHAGDLVLNSMNMIVGAVGIAPVLGCVSPAYYVFYDNDNNYTVTRYCDYIFKNKRLRGCLFSLGQGIMAIDRGDGRINTCRLKVSRDDLGRIMLPCPPIEEQCRIISFLDKQCAAIDGIITEKQSLIDDLGTYKKSLIYETVTGKRRVC